MKHMIILIRIGSIILPTPVEKTHHEAFASCWALFIVLSDIGDCRCKNDSSLEGLIWSSAKQKRAISPYQPYIGPRKIPPLLLHLSFTMPMTLMAALISSLDSMLQWAIRTILFIIVFHAPI